MKSSLNNATVLDVVLSGSGMGVDSPFMVKIFEKCKSFGHDVVTFNYPYFDRGDGHSSGPELKEEIAILDKVLKDCHFEKYQKIRLIGKSLGGIVASYYLKQFNPNNFSVIVLGYVLGDIDLKNFPGEITIIQGQKDRFGDIEAVKKDLFGAISKQITFIEIPNADHSYRDPVTKEPRFEDLAIAKIL